MGSDVWSFHSSSSLVLLSLFFSLDSFSTYSWRLAFSSDNCLERETRHCQVKIKMSELWQVLRIGNLLLSRCHWAPISSNQRGHQTKGQWEASSAWRSTSFHLFCKQFSRLVENCLPTWFGYLPSHSLESAKKIKSAVAWPNINGNFSEWKRTPPLRNQRFSSICVTCL